MQNSADQDVSRALATLIDKPRRVLTFDSDLIDQLPLIVFERYGAGASSRVVEVPELQELARSLEAIGLTADEVVGLPQLLRNSGIDTEPFRVRAPHASSTNFNHWSERSADEDVRDVITLQRDLGMGMWNEGSARYSPELDVGRLSNYLRYVTTDPKPLRRKLAKLLGLKTFWEREIDSWIEASWIGANEPTLSIGPRWVTEIRFFREIVGLKQHVGLDLFSDVDQLVVEGDMHEMPFPDSRFGFVFIKNTVDKSYNVRKLVRELARVTRPGGVVAIDQVCGYGNCNPLTRTDIQSAGNLLTLFSAYTEVTQVLVNEDLDIAKIGSDSRNSGSTNLARLAIRL